jgi:hypothetical protein
MNKLDALLLQATKLNADVVRLEGEMVDSFTMLFEKTCNWRVI